MADPLSTTASIVAILQVTFKIVDILQDAGNASSEQCHFAAEISNVSTSLTSLLKHIEHDSQEPWQMSVQQLGEKDGVIYQYRIALEQLKAKLTTSSMKQAISKTVLWKFVKKDADSILARIERLKSLTQIALELDHFKLSQAIEKVLRILQNRNQTLLSHANSFQQDHLREERQRILNWLSLDSFEAQQSDLISSRQNETGSWFLESPEFKAWAEHGEKTLFCPGIPGAGKTMIAAITIDHLQRKVQDQDIGIAYVYCSYQRRAEQSVNNLLAAILKQLLHDRPRVTEMLSELHIRHVSRNTKPSEQDLSKSLETVLSSYQTVYLVIDALDECIERFLGPTSLLTICYDLQKTSDFRIMVTSRHTAEIHEKFEGLPQLEVRASSADVARYVKGQIHHLPPCIREDSDLQDQVQGKIIDAADGMFLLARLHVDSLRDKRTKAKVMTALTNFSKGSNALEHAYDKARTRIESRLPGDKALAKSALSWISYAQRPLSVTELSHALAVEPGDKELNMDNIPKVDDLVLVCEGLVTVDRESQIVRLVHYTTQHYLESIREEWDRHSAYKIASTCTTYLCFDAFRSGARTQSADLKIRLKKHPFVKYCADYWGALVANLQEEICEQAMDLLLEDHLVSSMSQISFGYPNFEDKDRVPTRSSTGIHLVATLGLHHLAEKLLAQSFQKSLSYANEEDARGYTPLACAAFAGHESIVRLLVERADVVMRWKRRGPPKHTPLISAARKGHDRVVRLLLSRGDWNVEPDRRDRLGRTALSYAAQEGHRSIVLQLLRPIGRVDADSRDRDGRTPLSHAAEFGRASIITVLCGRPDVEIDSKDKNGFTPLSYAARWPGCEEVVRRLLEYKVVHADSRDNKGRTPLSHAADRKNEDNVKLLLERQDVEADSKDYEGRTPLSYAANQQSEATVKLLLERKDVDADSRDNQGRTPLSHAAGWGRATTVELLLRRMDVEADSKDNNGRTPLSHAASCSTDVLRLLLKKEDVDAYLRDN
ncbi:hypothetical protein ACN47E_002179 [Coniothyrium glycines]